MAEPARPDYRNTDAYKKAERCAKIIEDWCGCTIDVNRDWSELIHDFAWALGLRVKIDLVEGGEDG